MNEQEGETHESERGASAIEYALLASLISIAIIVGAAAVGVEVDGMFQRVANAF